MSQPGTWLHPFCLGLLPLLNFPRGELLLQPWDMWLNADKKSGSPPFKQNSQQCSPELPDHLASSLPCLFSPGSMDTDTRERMVGNTGAWSSLSLPGTGHLGIGMGRQQGLICRRAFLQSHGFRQFLNPHSVKQ